MSSKLTFLVLFSFLLCSRVSAAGAARSIVFKSYTLSDQPDKMQKLREELRYYRGMKLTGGMLTGTGAVMIAVGQGLLWSSVALKETGSRHYDPVARDPLWLAGLGSTVLSAVPFAFGIPLLKYGTKKVRELKKQLPPKDLQ